MNDQIKLVEARGWRLGDSSIPMWQCPETLVWHLANELPDPFTDANDDYAVLEWVRKHHQLGSSFNSLFREVFRSPKFSSDSCANLSVCYKIGDYARAALKALE